MPNIDEFNELTEHKNTWYMSEEEILQSYLSKYRTVSIDEIRIWSDNTLTVGHDFSVDYFVVPQSRTINGYFLLGTHMEHHIYSNYTKTQLLKRKPMEFPKL
ncbi:hypothetical protein [Paenibacillus polymyxa]|uniref:hypothetical protein n=1 Tax=Paenibacillus polymyxa TaxID=1406 RepID=UPI000471ED0A|nr:hypothetical protein [Paenibacillus polymyxa]MDN4106193.1 hypothetical protein [Paenibacillus polymyxa]